MGSDNNMRVLNKVAFLILIQLAWISAAQASDLVCVEGKMKVTLGKVKTSDAVFKIQVFFIRETGAADSYTREILNPDDTFYIGDDRDELRVGDVFPLWHNPLLIELMNSKVSSDSNQAPDTRQFEPRRMGGAAKWILNVTFNNLQLNPHLTSEAFLRKIQKLEVIRTRSDSESGELFHEKMENLHICGSSS